MATAGTVGIDEPASGSIDKYVDNNSLTRSSKTVLRQNVCLADPTTVEAFAPVSATNGLTVDLGSNNDVTVTSGAITETNSTAILADTASMDTNLTTIAGAVSGGEVQVTLATDSVGLATSANQPAVYTDDTSTHATGTSEGNLLMAAATPTDGSVDANDIGALAMSTDRRLHVDSQIVGQDDDLTIADGGNAITVDWNGTAPPIGAGVEATALRVTLATNSTGVLSVDDNGSSLTVDAANDGSLNVQIGDGSNTATIRNLASNDALNVAIVDGSGSQITTFGGGTQYTEDAAAAANPTGTMPVLVRADTPAGVTTTDGDVVAQRATDYGAAYCQILDSSGNFIDTFGGSGGTAAADDADFTAGTTQGTLVQGVYESSPTSVTDGDMGAIGITQTREVRVSIEADNVGIGGGTQYTEDAAAAADPVGNALILIRDDALSGQTTADGDNVATRGTDKGEMYVKHVDAIPVTDNGGALTVDGTVTETNSAAILADTASMDTNLGTVAGAVAGSEMQVDIVADGAGLATAANQPAVYVDDTSTHATGTSEGNLLMAAATPTDGSVDANDIGAVAMSTDRRLHTDTQIVGQDADITIADGGNDISVDWAGTVPPIGAGTEAAALRVTLATDSTGLVSVDDGGGAITVDWAGTAPPIGAGTEATALRVTVATDSTGTLSVDDGGGALTVDGTVAVSSLPASTNTLEVVGDAAHDAAIAGNPVRIAGNAVAYGSTPTNVAAGDTCNLYTDRGGLLFNIGGAPNTLTVELMSNDGETNTALVTVGAGTAIVVTMVQVYVDADTTASATSVRIGFGTAAVPTEPSTGATVAKTVFAHMGIAPGSGSVVGNGSGIVGVGATNEDLRVTCSAPTSGQVNIVVTYYTVSI